MIVVTYVYKDTPGTKRMIESVRRCGYEIAIIRTSDNVAEIVKQLFECYKRASTGHEHIIYADAADCYFQRPVNVPDDCILYSTEKQCFPFPDWASQYPAGGNWKYLNGGGYCGPSKLLVEFWERYKIHPLKGNPQAVQMQAYFDAVKDGFPIKLDVECEEFQSIAFEADGEFEMRGGMLHNLITGTIPAVLHGNGLTPLEKFIV